MLFFTIKREEVYSFELFKSAVFGRFKMKKLASTATDDKTTIMPNVKLSGPTAFTVTPVGEVVTVTPAVSLT